MFKQDNSKACILLRCQEKYELEV